MIDYNSNRITHENETMQTIATFHRREHADERNTRKNTI